jgi:myosin heavy subunit
VKVLLRKLRDKDQTISDLEARLSKAVEDSRLRTGQIAEYKQIIEEYDFKFQGLLDKTNASLERVMVQKNSEIAKLREDASAAIDSERNKAFALRRDHKSKISEMEKELDKQSQLMRLMQEENKKLMDDYTNAHSELNRIKEKLTDSHFLSSTDYKLLDGHFQDLENMQNALTMENDRLKAALEEKTREALQLGSRVTAASHLLYKARVDIGQLSRAMRVIRQTPTISALTVLLALKKDPYPAFDGSPYEQLSQGVEVLGREVKDLESSLVEWFSEASGKACLVS